MDVDREKERAMLLLGGAAMFIVSCFVCYGELTYLIRGREITGTVIKVYETHSRFRSAGFDVEFAFTEPDGTPRDGMDHVGLDMWLQPGATVDIQYTPGKAGRSRVAGFVNWFCIGVVVVTISLVGFSSFRVWREYSQPLATRRRGRR